MLKSHRRDDRAYKNTLSDGSLSTTDISSIKNKSQQTLSDILQSISAALQDGKISDSDSSVYTGLSGLALLNLRLYQVQREEKYLSNAESLIQRSSAKGRAKDCTFLCGDCGPLAVKALIAHYRNATQERNENIQKILAMGQEVCTSASLPNEMLYGRAGYLYTLLFLRKHVGPETIDKAFILQVADSIVAQGRDLSAHIRSRCPLEYVWYDTPYSGAAHGHAGIFYMLLKVKQLFPVDFNDSLLIPSIDFLLTTQFPSGNFPSSLESGDRDRLVHWCHGAPGFVYMFSLAYQIYGDVKYKKAAEACSEVVWDRGLLQKGFGICHGAAGNGYTFLNVYRMNNDSRQLARAYRFAEWCCQVFTLPWGADRPYSLFEGSAGTAYFLADMCALDEQSGFPAFEL